ncbi:MAG: 6-bladed beta-propeller [Balneolaceae bacterium]|nr:6-bladed beta-propeller [Balneolaceae bacterium]
MELTSDIIMFINVIKINPTLLTLLLFVSCTKQEKFDPLLINTTSFDVVLSVEFSPSAFEVDSEGFYYLANSADGSIKKFDNRGSLIASAGRFGQGPGEYAELQPIKICVSRNRVYAYNIGHMFVHVYSKDLDFKETISLEYPLLDMRSIDDEFFLFSYIAMSQNDKNFEVMGRNYENSTNIHFQISRSNHRNFYFRNIRFVTPLTDGMYLKSYAYVNSNSIYNINGELIKNFKIPGYPDQISDFLDSEFSPPPGMEAPEFSLISQVIYDSKNGEIMILEGDYSEYLSERIHAFTISGDYLYTRKLPEKVDFIAVQNGILYGLVRRDERVDIVYF